MLSSKKLLIYYGFHESISAAMMENPRLIPPPEHPPIHSAPAEFHRKAISSTTGEFLLQSTDLTNRNHRQGRWLAQPYKGVLQVGLKAHRNVDTRKHALLPQFVGGDHLWPRPPLCKERWHGLN